MRFCVLLICFFIFSSTCCANDSTFIPILFQKLLDKQINQTDFFVEGSFTSFRQRGNNNTLKPDNNIFFTALIAYTLQELKPYLNSNEKVVADTIINRTKKAFAHYQNISGRLTYNFWRTDNGNDFFPNDKILNKFKKSLALADDLDDTSIILSVLEIDDSTAEKSHFLMQQFANGYYATIKNTFKKYRNLQAYSTWYGKKMPVDFDFGVHCNILSFVNKYKLNWRNTDSTTYNLLMDMICNNYVNEYYSYISPYYSYPSVLYYHLGRLYTSGNTKAWENLKPEIIKKINTSFKNTNGMMYKILLLNTLYKMNASVPDYELSYDDVVGGTYNTDFVYYTGHLFGHLNNSIKTVSQKLSSITQFKWYSSAFNDCLLLEYLILKHRRNK